MTLFTRLIVQVYPQNIQMHHLTENTGILQVFAADTGGTLTPN